MSSAAWKFAVAIVRGSNVSTVVALSESTAAEDGEKHLHFSKPSAAEREPDRIPTSLPPMVVCT